jgi:hypothetical protein
MEAPTKDRLVQHIFEILLKGIHHTRDEFELRMKIKTAKIKLGGHFTRYTMMVIPSFPPKGRQGNSSFPLKWIVMSISDG